MSLRSRKVLLVSAAALLLILPPFYLSMAERRAPADPVLILVQYLKASYARDLKEAYHLISFADHRLKDEKSYIRERGAFTGFTLDVARRLADRIEATPIEKKMTGSRAHISLKLRLPDANRLAPHLLDWDEERLNTLPPKEQMLLVQKVEQWSRRGELPVIEGQQDFDLIKEKTSWRVFLNWAAGTRLTFQEKVPGSLPLEISWEQRDLVTRPGELFNIHLRVKNLSDREVSTRLLHRVEPKEMQEHLDLVECGLLFPTRVLPREEQEYSSTYLVRADLPDGIRHLAVTYEFADVR